MVYLANKGKAFYDIAIPTDACYQQRFAAEELALFLGKSTGATFDIIDQKDARAPFISVGQTQLLNAMLGGGGKLEKPDAWRAFSADGNYYIYGGSPFGTIYGAYGFLAALTNLKIYTVDCFTQTQSDSLPFKEIDITKVPDIDIRTIGINPLHYEKPTLKEPLSGENGGANSRYVYRMGLRGMCEGWGISGHTYFRILPPAIYREKHPDWYSSDGKNLCLTSIGGRKEFTKRLKKIIEDTPDATEYMLGQEDNNTICDCEGCKLLTQKYDGYPGALMLSFTNAVAKDINSWLGKNHPKRRVNLVTFAYQKTANPPVEILPQADGSTKYRCLYPDLITPKNTGIMVAPLATHISYSFFDSRSRLSFDTSFNTTKSVPTRDIIQGWMAYTDNMYIWSYGADFVDYLAPYPVFGPLEQNYRGFTALNLKYMFEQGSYSSYIPNLTELKIFVFSRMAWDGSQNVRALMEEFCKVYYGKAAPWVLKYIDLIQKHCDSIVEQGKRFYFFIRFDDFEDISLAKFWPKEVLEEALACLEEGEKALSTADDKVYKDRLHIQTLPTKYLMLLNYQQEYPKERQKYLISEFEDIVAKTGMKCVGESQVKTIQQLKEQFNSQLD